MGTGYLKTARQSAQDVIFSSVTTLWEFDCRDKLQRMVSVTWHAGQMGTGEIVQTGNPSPFDWRPIATGKHWRGVFPNGVRREMRARQSSELSPLTGSTCSRN